MSPPQSTLAGGATHPSLRAALPRSLRAASWPQQQAKCPPALSMLGPNSCQVAAPKEELDGPSRESRAGAQECPSQPEAPLAVEIAPVPSTEAPNQSKEAAGPGGGDIRIFLLRSPIKCLLPWLKSLLRSPIICPRRLQQRKCICGSRWARAINPAEAQEGGRSSLSLPVGPAAASVADKFNKGLAQEPQPPADG